MEIVVLRPKESGVEMFRKLGYSDEKIKELYKVMACKEVRIYDMSKVKVDLDNYIVTMEIDEADTASGLS